MKVKLRLKTRPTSLRCAYCHDEVADEAWRCPTCATSLHAECHERHGRCTTLACDPIEISPERPRRSRRRPRRRNQPSSETVGKGLYLGAILGVAFAITGGFLREAPIEFVTLYALLGLLIGGMSGAALAIDLQQRLRRTRDGRLR